MAFEGVALEAYAPTTHNFSKVDAWEPYARDYCNQSYNAHVYRLVQNSFALQYSNCK
jgi:hypothetical protein